MIQISQHIIGIDLGSQLSGNTVVAYVENNVVFFQRSKKNKSSDDFLISLIQHLQPQHIFIDAPLSLPGVYSGKPGFNDYFYRKCDRRVRAMSPMFLGGLTARAIKLKDMFPETEFHESYPGGLARHLKIDELGYKMRTANITSVKEVLEANSGLKTKDKSNLSWHHIDAFLTLLIAQRYFSDTHQSFGDPNEGQIIF
jgi:predicted nuclease with RNAse H fold